MAETDRTDKYHHGDLRQTLMNNCLKMIEEKGVSGFTLREVARISGVSPAAPYHHFKSKTELLAAVAVMGFDMLNEAQRKIYEQYDDPVLRLNALGKSYVMFAVNHKVYFHVMFRADSEVLWKNRQVMIVAKQALSYLENAIRESFPKTAADDDSHFRATVLTCWSMAHGLASLWVDGPLKSVESGKLDLNKLVDLIFSRSVSP